MKKLFIYTFLLGILAACGDTKTTTQNQENQQEVIEQPQEPEQEVVEQITVNQEGIYGYYVGMFEAEEYKPNKKPSYYNKINIAIENISPSGEVQGFSVVAGNKRPFSGKAIIDGDKYIITAKEPGDDRYDGQFSFTLYNQDELLIKGTWTSNDKNLSVTKRKYELEKMNFEYDKDIQVTENVLYDGFYDTYDDGMAETATEQAIIINASNTELKSEDIENLYTGDLEIIRNAIYARHGYSFKNRRMRYVFDQVDWYIPVSTNILADLTDLEKKNIDLLKRYEKHSEKYYDAFGR